MCPDAYLLFRLVFLQVARIFGFLFLLTLTLVPTNFPQTLACPVRAVLFPRYYCSSTNKPANKNMGTNSVFANITAWWEKNIRNLKSNCRKLMKNKQTPPKPQKLPNRPSKNQTKPKPITISRKLQTPLHKTWKKIFCNMQQSTVILTHLYISIMWFTTQRPQEKQSIYYSRKSFTINRQYFISAIIAQRQSNIASFLK